MGGNQVVDGPFGDMQFGRDLARRKAEPDQLDELGLPARGPDRNGQPVLRVVEDQVVVLRPKLVGLRSIAVPVRDTRGTVVAAINVGTRSSRFSLAELETRCLPPLTRCADELTRLLLG